MTAYCGVYPGRGCLVAVLVDREGRASPAVTVDRTDDARRELLMHLDGPQVLEAELVVPEWLVRLDSITQLATARNIPIWIASTGVVDSLRFVARARRPATVAALLARLPLASSLREHLRRIRPADQRQLALL